MEAFLMLNGCEIKAEVDDQERIILQLAAGKIDRADFLDWLKFHLVPLKN